MYSRLNRGVYGQRMLICMVTNGSRIGVSPDTRIMPLAMLIEARPTLGKPPVDLAPCNVTQELVNDSFGASAYAMLARNGWPSDELTFASPSSSAANGSAARPPPNATSVGSKVFDPTSIRVGACVLSFDNFFTVRTPWLPHLAACSPPVFSTTDLFYGQSQLGR